MAYLILLVVVILFVVMLKKSDSAAKTQEPPAKKQPSPYEKREALKRAILSNMKPGERYTVEDMLAQFICFAPETGTEYVEGILMQLGARGAGEVSKTEEQGKTYYSLSNSEEGQENRTEGIEKALTPQQKKDEETKQGILANMEVGKRYTILDMLNGFDCFDADTTPQRVSALLSQLGARGTGEVVRTEEKGKAYFTLTDRIGWPKKGAGGVEDELTPMQKKNEETKRGILANMEIGGKYSISDMLIGFDCFDAETTPQRVSALLSQLGPGGSGEVMRVEKNGRAYFLLTEKGAKSIESLPARPKCAVRNSNPDEESQRNQSSPPPHVQSSYSNSAPRYSPPTHTTSTPSYSSPQYSYDPSIPLYSLNTGRGLSQSELDYYGTAAYNGFPAAMMDVIGADRTTLDSMLGRLDAIKDVADEIKKMRRSSIDRAAFEQACYRAGVDPDSFRQSDLDELQNFLNQP